MCVYYRALNEVTIKNRFPLFRIDDLFGHTMVSVCSLKSIFNQDRIS
jgi:hypothetical protein